MISLADSLVSTSSRPLAIRRRPDLSAVRQFYQGTSYWIVKEPVGLSYFRFQEEEYAILDMLDGTASLDDIKRRYEAEFPPGTIAVEEIARFIGNLFQSGLLMANVANQGDQLRQRHDEKLRKQRMASLTNVLAIRFKGIDPERLLDWLHPKVAWFFSTPCVLFCCLMGLCAALLVSVQFDTFQQKLPAFHDFFASENWIWLGLTLAVTKVLHEFGHGLSCKHFGGECHEMGVMILVLTPCLYCNVSDSWMLPNKWHRAAIGAAGMYVELVIASFCTFIWWFSEPGLLNYLCLSVMFVSSVSTILFNGNPLLRYDGYYILSDVLEIPNLRQKATSILNRKMGRWFLGLEEPDDPFLPQRKQALFAIYSVAAVVYRWFVVIAILFFLIKVFEPYGLQKLGQAIALFSIYGMAIQPLWKLWKFLSVPGRVQQVKRGRLIATLSVCGAVIAAVLFFPLPYHVYCPVYVQPQGARQLFVEVPGTVDQVYVQVGDEVSEGKPIAELTNLDLDAELIELQGNLAVLRQQRLTLQRERLRPGEVGHEAGNALQQANERFASLKERLGQKQKDRDRLHLVAPVKGTVFAPELESGKVTVDGALPTWSGTPLDRQNRGAYLSANTLFCQIGNPNEMEVVLAIDQSSRNLVREGQRVEIKLDHLPAETFETTLDQVDTTPMKVSPRPLSSKAGGALVTETDEQGRERPSRPTYRALAQLPDSHGRLRSGLCGQAKIYAAPRTIGSRLWRYLNETFSFRL